MTIGKFAQDLMVSTNLSNEEILRRIKINYPSSKTGMNSIYWYRSKISKTGSCTKSRTNTPEGQWIFVPSQLELKI